MSVVYKDVLERFVKYREQRNISQNGTIWRVWRSRTSLMS